MAPSTLIHDFAFSAPTGERRGTGIRPRHSGRLLPVNVDHVTSEVIVVGTIGHQHPLVGRNAAGA